ncbi:MAG: XdhC family protein [Pseudomonadota bacterium]
MDPQVLKKLNLARKERKAAIVVTHLDDGRDRVVLEEDDVYGDLGQAVSDAFQSGKSSKVESVDGRLFLNVHLPSPRLVIVGAVHISQALVPMARIAGFDMRVIDPRTAFASEERFKGVALYPDWPEDVLKDNPLDRFTAVVAVTHDPKIDDFPILAALKANCFYVGALGSRKTHSARCDRLREAGALEEQLERIRAPIGLDIGAASPAEIAVAVLAEIIEDLRHRGSR